MKKTDEFIKEIRADNIYSIYYTAKASLLLERYIGEDLKKQLSSIFNSKRYFGLTDIFSEVSSEFSTTFMALELSDILKIKVDNDDAAKWLLSYRNEDGGFGTQGSLTLTQPTTRLLPSASSKAA